ncbi:hypothetical protein MNBD_IGNAVI01-3206 [hydrothermal vent metagenome]|uniref:Uncharacterized protein n=1 Tax=hydrothermal vent metagenome TaxID=652676 RepID=A0A3B1C4C0_9ZZZZ
MKKLINISKKWKKLTAIFLLLNFIATPLIFAFPEEDCNAACEIESTIHECNSDAAKLVEDKCCDLMDTNFNNLSSASTDCEMEITDINCTLAVNDQVGTTYIIPKTIDNKVDFIQLAEVDLQIDNSNIEMFDLIQELSFESQPPIYITISSFLI